jgi:RHS repeat-associated protein
VSFPGGRVLTLQHDSNGTVLSATDPAGGVVSFTYDASGNQASFTDPLGRSTSTSYRSDGQLASSSFTYNGQPVSYGYAYDSNGAITQVTLPDGTTGQVTLDAVGLPTQTTDAIGSHQQMVHDPEGNLLTLSDFDDRVTAYEYDAEDRVTAAELPGGLRVERALDPLGRPSVVTLPNGAQTTTQYDAAGRIVSQTRTGEGARTFAYDAAGNLTQATAPDGGVTTHTYDANGRRTSTTDPLGATTQFQYDDLDNLTQTVLPDGAVLKNEFDALGRRTAIEDPTGARAEFGYDAASQIVSTLDPAGGVTVYTRDGLGEVASLTTPAGNAWSFTYDAKGLKLTQTYPWGGTQTREIDALGRITKLTDPTGDFGTFTYDAAGRLLTTTLSAGDLELRTYDGAGQLVTVTDNGDTTVLAYGSDALIDRVDHPDGSFVEYAYDAAGRIASIRTPGGTTTYVYDSSGRLASADDSALGITTYTYDLAGRVAQMTLPDGSDTVVTRDVRGAITAIDTTVGPTVLRDTTYSYDAAGKLTNATEIGRTVDYQYDPAGRVVSEVRTGPDPASVGYAYDANWSLTQIGGRALTYDGSMRLASDGVFTQYAYDAGGRPIQRSNGAVTEQFFYDALGRLIRVERTGALPAVVDLDYDHAGLLRRVVADGVGRTLLWDSVASVPRILEERDDNGLLIRRYVYGLGPVGVFDGAGHVLHRDPTGSVRVVTALNGTIESDYAFSAYGEQTLGASNSISPLRFAGEFAVPELGLYFLRSRFYDPVAGRFLTPDLLEPTATAWLTFNPYQYGNGNPISFRDPLGNFSLGSVSISISIAGILAGLAINIFPSPLEWIVTGLTGAPPESSFPVGAEAGVKLTFPGPGTAGVWSLQIGTKLKVLVSPAMSMLTWSLDAGAGLAIPPPAALISKGPSASASLGVVFGEQSGPPKTPGISASLQISGTAADRIANKYTRTVKAIGVLANVGTIFLTTVQGSQQFQKSSAAISFKIGQPTPDVLREIFTISLSANQNPSAAGTFFASWTSAWGGLMGAASSTYSPGYLSGSFYFTAGLAFTVSFPIVYFTWDGSSLNGGVPDYVFVD